MIDKYLLEDLSLRRDEKGELARWVIQLQADVDTERRKSASLESVIYARDTCIAELEAKLATPVRLPDMRQSSSGDRYQWSDGAHNYRLDVISMLLGAGLTVAVEGDDA